MESRQNVRREGRLGNRQNGWHGDGFQCHELYTCFAARGAFPMNWIEKDGQVVYGSVQPEMKQALAELSAMYKEGLIDKQFAVRMKRRKRL